MSWRVGGHRVAGVAIPFNKKVSREVVLYFKRCGSYERSVSYGGYESCGARKCEVIVMKGDLKLTTPVSGTNVR